MTTCGMKNPHFNQLTGPQKAKSFPEPRGQTEWQWPLFP